MIFAYLSRLARWIAPEQMLIPPFKDNQADYRVGVAFGQILHCGKEDEWWSGASPGLLTVHSRTLLPTVIFLVLFQCQI